jgi:hypothetical protein
MKSEFKKVNQALMDTRKDYAKKHEFMEKSKKALDSLIAKDTPESSPVLIKVHCHLLSLHFLDVTNMHLI